jgi:hypothetical protein
MVDVRMVFVMMGVRMVFAMGVVVVMAVRLIRCMGVVGCKCLVGFRVLTDSMPGVDHMVLMNCVNIMGFEVFRLVQEIFLPDRLVQEILLPDRLVLEGFLLDRLLLRRLRMLNGGRRFGHSRDDGAGFGCGSRFGAGCRPVMAGGRGNMGICCFRVVVPRFVGLLGDGVVAFASQRLFLFAEFLAGQRPGTIVTHGV